jgi:hypothetical protein
MSIDLLQLLDLRDRPSLDELYLLAQEKLPRASIAAELHSLWRRGHVSRERRCDGLIGHALTDYGRKARDLLIHARTRIGQKRNRPMREAIADAVKRSGESVPFPRSKLRLLAQAAIASGKPLDAALRDAINLAINEAA